MSKLKERLPHLLKGQYHLVDRKEEEILTISMIDQVIGDLELWRDELEEALEVYEIEEISHDERPTIHNLFIRILMESNRVANQMKTPRELEEDKIISHFNHIFKRLRWGAKQEEILGLLEEAHQKWGINTSHPKGEIAKYDWIEQIDEEIEPQIKIALDKLF